MRSELCVYVSSALGLTEDEGQGGCRGLRGNTPALDDGQQGGGYSRLSAARGREKMSGVICEWVRMRRRRERKKEKRERRGGEGGNVEILWEAVWIT
jgi:hypothetical protein